MSLYQYFSNNTGRPINKWVHYFPIYERYFTRYRDRSILFLEIGSGQGGSGQMWKHYFGPLAQIVSIDIRPECTAFADEQVHIRVGDQSDPAFLQSLVDEFGAPDIVLDDGSHIMEHVNASFRFLFPKLNCNGTYLVEDMHTAYRADWQGGLRRPGTFMENMKAVVDDMHAAYLETPSEPLYDFTSSISGLHFHDSIVVLERQRPQQKYSKSIPHTPGQTVW